MTLITQSHTSTAPSLCMPVVTMPWPHGPNGYDHVYVGNVDPVPPTSR
jgi:hypothetical protein